VHAVAHDIAKKLKKPASEYNLVFITTPSEPEQEADRDMSWLKRDRKVLVKAGFKVTDYTITGKIRKQIKDDLKDYDIIYMSGGNSFYMIEKLQETRSMSVFKKFIEEDGKIYIGSSAGSMITAPDVYALMKKKHVEYSKLPNYRGLGLVNFLIFPHWGRSDFKQPYLKERLPHAYKTTKAPIIVLKDNHYIQVEDDWYRIVEVK